jgi:hypothetical protein
MKDNKHIKSFGKFNENLNISDVSDSYLDTDKKAVSYLIDKNFKTTDNNSWRKGGINEFTNEEYEEIKSIVDVSIISNNLYPSTYRNTNTISLMFDMKKIKNNLNIVNLTIQKTDYYCVHLQEYTGDRDYARYDKTNTFLYQFSFDELKSFLTFLTGKINLLYK